MAKAKKTVSTANNLVIRATAGSGKTTTIVDGVSFCTNPNFVPNYTPSDEQRAIWNWMSSRVNCHSNIIFLAFNRSIADEIGERITHGESKTLHQLGLAVLKIHGVKVKKPNNWKTINLFMTFIGKEGQNPRVLDKPEQLLLDDVKELVKTCKDDVMTEATISEDYLSDLCTAKGMEPTFSMKYMVEIVSFILQKGSEFKTGVMAKPIEIDFDDMIYLPARFNMSCKFDVMIVDESQDLSNGKLRLVMNQECDKYIFVGDPDQAIFAFAGANCDSFNVIIDTLETKDVLPLSYTFRCGKNIVKEAQQIVGNAINYAETNHDGLVKTIMQDEMDIEVGDMLVSRVNAPLMSIAWQLFRERKPVKVIGRDIGSAINKIIKKLAKDNGVTEAKHLIHFVEQWKTAEIGKLQQRNQDTENLQMMVEDQAECIIQLAFEVETIPEMTEFISNLFTDEDMEAYIRLSSIHRAKGLEANRVFFYNPKAIPHKMAKTEEQQKQEMNLKFVAITRAKKELYYVEPVKRKRNTEELAEVVEATIEPEVLIEVPKKKAAKKKAK